MISLSEPFVDIITPEHAIVRLFDPSLTDEEDYVWHRDREDREVTVIEGEGWLFQFDNELPFSINNGDIFFVPKMVYHRIIPGNTQLKVEINELVEKDTRFSAT